MAKEKKIDLSALQQAFDTSWGRSSTPNAPNFSVKFKIAGGPTLIASYIAVVNFGTEREMVSVKQKYAEEAEAIINEVLKDVKKRYNDLSGLTLSTEETYAHNGLELTSAAIFNPKRTAYFRRSVTFSLM